MEYRPQVTRDGRKNREKIKSQGIGGPRYHRTALAKAVESTKGVGFNTAGCSDLIFQTWGSSEVARFRE